MRGITSSAPKLVCALTLAGFTFFAPNSPAQQAASKSQSLSRSLITQPVEESRLTVLHGNTHPLARPQFDLGSAPASLPAQRMQLVLKRSPAQEAALRKLLDDQQDKASPSYKKWLTPEDFGRQFGPSDNDIQTITSWLQSHGFQVGATKGRTVLEFSGSASQVQGAFHTSIHKYVVNGEQHWANAADPSIPTALSSAVSGVMTMHDFRRKPLVRYSKNPIPGKTIPGKRPAITFSDNSHGLAPLDFATIYNSNPTINSGVSGSGVTIGVIGRSNLYSVDSPAEDVIQFRSSQIFNVCCGSFNVILNGPDPGDLGGGDEFEATLDSTWAGAVAPSANVDFVVSASTNTSDGVDLSEIYIIENNLADVMTESFSSCEVNTTSTDAAAVLALAEQAAAQGITYFVSSGDSGSEGCDDPNAETVATGPPSVNLLGSSPFTTPVGGTIFDDSASPTTYWSTTNTGQESALSYIPEDVWNDSCLAASCGTSANIFAGGGGASIYFPKPSWQTGVTGIPNDGARDVPDVSLTAAIHDGYVLCLDGSCIPDSQGAFSLYLVGGTSASAPSFAGIMALVDQKMDSLNPTQGFRQGAAGYVLYRLAAAENSTFSTCNASSTTVLPASTCTFNDVTVGSNAVPGEANYGLSTAQFQSGTGYDQATGLGSVNVTNLVNNWSTVTFSPSSTTLSVAATTLVHGASLPFTVTVAPGSSTGVPSGDISLIAGTSTLSGTTSLGFWTLLNGAVSASTNDLPGGMNSLTARYAGDATFASSQSIASQVITVTPEPSTTALSVLGFDNNGNQFNFTGGPFGSFVYLRADVAGASGHGTPTGSVTFTDTSGAIAGNPFSLNSGDVIRAGSNTATPNGFTFDSGTHTISASYTGDASFNLSSSTPSISFTIQPGFFASIPTSASMVVVTAPGASGTSSISVSNSTGFSGTIALACSSGLPAGAACAFSPASVAAAGTAATVTSAITVTTTAPTANLVLPGGRIYFAGWMTGLSFLFSIFFVGSPRSHSRKRSGAPGLFLGLMLLVLLFVPACGGGSSSHSTPPPPPPVSTPAGTYTVNVNATSGSTTSASQFTLVVQ